MPCTRSGRQDEGANEKLTDAASIVAGLGKLVLNGTMTEMADATGEMQVLGYLDIRERIELYNRINAYHGISNCKAKKHLTNDALNLF